jgi:hypothetical protein
VLELHQRHAPLAGVAVREVRQVEAAASPQVERLHVLGLLLLQGRGLQVVEEPAQRPGELHRQRRDRGPQQGQPGQQVLVGIAEEQ